MIRSLCLVVLLACFATSAAAQEATLQSPEVVTAVKVKVSSFKVSGSGVEVQVAFQTSADAVKRLYTVTTEVSEVPSFLTAIGSARPTETGAAVRRMNFRILGWLVDNGKLVDSEGAPIAVTLVP